MHLIVRTLLSIAGAVLASTAPAQEVRDRMGILEDLTGSGEGESNPTIRTRSIVPEAADGPVRVESTGYVATSLPAIQFDYNSADLTVGARHQLTELGAALLMEPLRRARFAVQGHTDSRGGAVYNRDLSRRRAQSVTEHLSVVSGISPNRLVAVGVGEDLPLHGVPLDDPSNRRVEVIRLGAIAPVQVTTAREDQPRARALLVGIDDYKTVSTLKGAPINDVREMREFLQGHLGYKDSEIMTLTDSEATREAILEAMQEWLIDADRGLFYYSGHGYYQQDTDGDEDDGLDETLVPYDVAIKNRVATGMITDDEIERIVATSSTVLDLVIDACHSGTIHRGASGNLDWRFIKSPRLPNGMPLALDGQTRGLGADASPKGEVFLDEAQPHVTVWSAVGPRQKALVDNTTGPRYVSVYTYRLINGAVGAADQDGDRIVTPRELHNHVLTESAAYCETASMYCLDGLVPELSISGDGQLESAFVSFAPPMVSAETTALASLAKDILVASTDNEAGPRDDGISISLDPGPKLKIGETIEISVKSSVEGFLVLLDIDSKGGMTQVFPNQWSPPEYVGQDKTLTIPGSSAGFRLRAQPPLGQGTLIAVVSDTELGGSLLGLHKDLSVVSRPDAYVVELAGLLRRWSKAGWAYGKAEYQIYGD